MRKTVSVCAPEREKGVGEREVLHQPRKRQQQQQQPWVKDLLFTVSLSPLSSTAQETEGLRERGRKGQQEETSFLDYFVEAPVWTKQSKKQNRTQWGCSSPRGRLPVFVVGIYLPSGSQGASRHCYGDALGFQRSSGTSSVEAIVALSFYLGVQCTNPSGNYTLLHLANRYSPPSTASPRWGFQRC